jgi:pyruvate/2-oxoacid:ferredoxin oxidoreductase beta subunit
MGGGEAVSQPLSNDHLPREELLDGGHLACPGCGGALALRLVLKGLGEKTVVALAAGCWTSAAGPWPQSALRVPLLHAAAATAAATAAGIQAGLAARGDDAITVLAWAGGAGTFDLGLQALSGAAERNDDILYCCYDDEAYMGPGIRRAVTPWGAETVGTPAGRPQAHPRKDLLAILAAHGIPYAATACVAYPDDLLAKVHKARAARGTRFLQILAPCPPGWQTADDATIELGRLAVQSRVFPLLEVEDGARWRVSLEPAGAPVRDYIRRQGRFRHLTDEDVERIQQHVDARWQMLERRIQASAES